MAAVVAERCGVTAVSDFRSRDLAAGGQGAPLAALTDYLLLRHPSESRALLHLGGMARLVYLPAGCRLHEVLGFEAGPCNLLLDNLVRQLTAGRESFDTGGKHAVQGKCIEPLLQSWLAHPALQRRPPRSLPRQPFAEEFAQQAFTHARQHQNRLHDLLCTATHFVARNITTAMRRFLPAGASSSGQQTGSRPPIDRVLLSGGGVRNGLLWHLLEQQLGIPLARTDEAGIPADLRKPLSFGLLAGLTLDGVAANVPSATGAAGSRLLGNLTPGSSSNWAKCLQWMAQQAVPVSSGY
jgi:anhydro-N-acetylmuramic acid kinase